MTKYIPQGTDGDKFIVKGVYSKKYGEVWQPVWQCQEIQSWRYPLQRRER